jgi:divalent metal cation (Fe/Co/Zn/Cd) transporter
VLGLSVNVATGDVKLLAGIFGRSYALIADAIESMADAISSIIVWRGCRCRETAGQGASVRTREGRSYRHGGRVGDAPGRGRADCCPLGTGDSDAASLAGPYTLVVLLGVVLIKEGLFRIVGRVGEEVESGAVKADAWHHRSDAITSAAARFRHQHRVGGRRPLPVGGRLGGHVCRGHHRIQWPVRLLRPALDELMDAAPKEDIVGLARSIALQVNGVKGVEKCFARKMGYEYWLDMHIEVDGGLSVAVAHELSHTVKDAIRRKLPRFST